MATAETKPSLYRRLGGYDVIAAIVDDLFARLQADPRFARFASGRSLDSHRKARQLLVDQLCALAGGPCFYIGRDMKTTHAGLEITQAEWDTNFQYAREVLSAHCLPEAEQVEFLELFTRYKDDIVTANTATGTSAGNP